MPCSARSLACRMGAVRGANQSLNAPQPAASQNQTFALATVNDRLWSIGDALLGCD